MDKTNRKSQYPNRICLWELSDLAPEIEPGALVVLGASHVDPTAAKRDGPDGVTFHQPLGQVSKVVWVSDKRVFSSRDRSLG